MALKYVEMWYEKLHEPDAILDSSWLIEQHCVFRDTGGVSQENRTSGFKPAFKDSETGCIYLSRYSNGRIAPFHTFDGLPENVILSRNKQGKVDKVKRSLIAGFLRDDCFYSRDEAARQIKYEGTPRRGSTTKLC